MTRICKTEWRAPCATVETLTPGLNQGPFLPGDETYQPHRTRRKRVLVRGRGVHRALDHLAKQHRRHRQASPGVSAGSAGYSSAALPASSNAASRVSVRSVHVAEVAKPGRVTASAKRPSVGPLVRSRAAEPKPRREVRRDRDLISPCAPLPLRSGDAFRLERGVSPRAKWNAYSQSTAEAQPQPSDASTTLSRSTGGL